MRLHKNKYNLNENIFETIDSEGKAYILGFLYADGYNSNSHINLRIQARDIEILIFMQRLFETDAPIKFLNKSQINPNWQDMCNLNICSSKICKDLTKLGCMRNKTFQLQFPTDQVPKHLVHHFIRGYFDGDGSIYHSKHNIFGFSIRSNPEFCKKIANIFEETLQIYPYLRAQVGKTGINGHLEVTGRLQVIKIMEWLYQNATIFLSRKYKKYLEFQNYEKRWNYKKIFQFDKKKKLIAEYKSISDAANKSKVERTNIIAAAYGRRKTAGGFIWGYL